MTIQGGKIMECSFDSHIMHSFDSFCKIVIRNEARNIKKQYARLRERQVSLTEVSEYDKSFIQETDKSIDNSELFIVLGMESLVSNLHLAEAINELNESKRKIILLYYFAGFNDREIGETISMSVGGVWYQRRKAEEELRERLETKYE